jgi:lipopolysaccharide/colanic/teichoic acid biosynthesis glycosyltransferase
MRRRVAENPVGSVATSQAIEQRVLVQDSLRARYPVVALAGKRAFDFAFALSVLVFISPVLLFIAILIKVDSKGPVLYVSERIGLHGKRFRFFKFRTMVEEADTLRGALLHLNERKGNLFKMSNDPRVTRLGRILRRYSLDELPQFFSVLTGQMSVIGPRPCLPCEYARFTKEQRKRVEMLPGITGLWQVEARNHPSADAYHKLSRFYVENWSLLLDLKILVKTVRVVAEGTGQ